MSGIAITTLGLPFRNSNFASGSPNVRHTDSLPGSTRIGPIIYSNYSSGAPYFDEAVYPAF